MKSLEKLNLSCKNGHSTIKHKHSWIDGCFEKTCLNGTVETKRKLCPQVNCTNPVVMDYCTFDDVGAGTSSVAAVSSGTNNVVNSASFSGLTGEDASVPGGINLRPALSFTGVTTDLVVPNGYQQVTFRGAVNPDAALGATWTADWTVLSESGLQID